MRYLIIGAGIAGISAAEKIRESDRTGKISILTQEAYPFYNRIKLIQFLADEVELNALYLKQADWYEKNNISLHLSTKVTKILAEEKKVVAENGKLFNYDRLLIATGARPFIPPIPMIGKNNVFTLRDIDDAKRIKEYVKNGNKKAVCIGGGVLGIEAANSLRKLGCKVSVVEYSDRLLPRQMDKAGSLILQRQLEKMGFSFFLGRKTEKIEDNIIFTNKNDRLMADTILISAGVRPRTELASTLGAKIEKGVIADDNLEIETAGIYVAGDLLQHNGRCYGIWPAAKSQGEIAGINMSGGNKIYEGTISSNLLKVVGINLFSIGNIDADGKYESIVKKDEDRFIYKKIVIEDGKPIGAILYGDVSDLTKIKQLIESGSDISLMADKLKKWD